MNKGGTSDEEFRKILEERSSEVAENPNSLHQLLGILDMLWMTHLEDLEALGESVGLRAYGQRDPLVEYRQEAHRLFKSFWNNFNAWVFVNLFKLASSESRVASSTRQSNTPSTPYSLPSTRDKIGRNDPCPCGSGKKYKRCGLLNSEEHRKNIQSKK